MISQSLKKDLFPTKKQLLRKINFNQINLNSNHFSIKISPDQKFHEWCIKIFKKEDTQNYLQNLKVEEAIRMDARLKREEIYSKNIKGVKKILGDCVVTGSILYSCILPENKTLIFDKESRFTLVLELKNKNISFKNIGRNFDQKNNFLKVINSNIKNKLKENNFVEWGNNKKYYNTQICSYLDHHGITIYKGFTFKAEILEDGLKLVVGPTNRIIRQKNYWQEFLSQKIKGKKKAAEYFIGKSGMCVYNHKIVRIDDVDFTKKISSAFPNKDYKDYSDYFKKNYNIELKYKNQFLLVNKKRTKKMLNGKVFYDLSITHYPPEILKPTGLTMEMKKDWRLMKDLGKITIETPSKKFANIKDNLQLLCTSNKSNLNFTIDSNSNKIVGFTLNKPKIVSKGKKSYLMKGDRIQVKEMMVDKAIDDWVFFYDFKNKDNYDCVLKNLKNSSKKFKIRIDKPKKVFKIDNNASAGDILGLLKKNGLKPKMVFFLITSYTSKFLYKKLKILLGKKGILSQFFTSFNPKKDSGNLSKFGNLVLQMSVKLGASPWGLNLNLKNTVIFGADVYHQKRNNSVGALVSIFGDNFTGRYSTQKIQKSGQEIMKNISDMIMTHLDHIVKKNKKVPENLIFYRDGVGEGQVQIVIRHEIQKIVSNLEKKYPNKTPKLTFVIVTKRLDERFAVKKNNNLYNPDKGLIIMDQIVKKENANFFMVSQKVNNGTARPTHYNIVLNQCGLSLNRIEELTYDLTHLYYNWMGAVKVPAVVQYAHTCTNLFGITQDDGINEKMQSQFHYL